ncbi:unnamed protein product [Discosporangium mesarthrocarpum]
MQNGPCNEPHCNVCNICVEGFKLRSNAGDPPGPGFLILIRRLPQLCRFISEREVDSTGKHIRIMSVCSVVAGKPFMTQVGGAAGLSPPQGYDSVVRGVSRQGAAEYAVLL